jgi:NlpC/P60 family
MTRVPLLRNLSSRNTRRVLALALAAWIAGSVPTAACAQTERTDVERIDRERMGGLAALVIDRARGLMGIPYKYAGSSPDTGFDCSGLVRYVFRETLGLNLPGRSEDISKHGDRPALETLKPGDLVFFNTLNRPYSHVGIYLGNREFLHSPASGGVVRVESMNLPYWNKRYQGARRLIDDDDRPGTLIGIVPEFTHGAEILVGLPPASTNYAVTPLSPTAEKVAEPTGVSPRAVSSKAVSTKPQDVKGPDAKAPDVKTPDAKAPDPLDLFIKKLKENH